MCTLREELQRKQQRWMAERERELDRHQANVFGVIGRGGDELALASW